jgi:hypothetical protein
VLGGLSHVVSGGAFVPQYSLCCERGAALCPLSDVQTLRGDASNGKQTNHRADYWGDRPPTF